MMQEISILFSTFYWQ